jgi:O-antigen/teichoic acid export membrane protein
MLKKIQDMWRQIAFGKNALAYGMGNIGLRAASFLLIPVYTRSLSLADYGLLATLLAVTQILTILIDAGLRKAQFRFTLHYQDQGRLGELLGTSILMNFINGAIVLLLCIGVGLPFFRLLLHTDQVIGYVVLSCAAALCQSLFVYITGYYRTRSEPVRFTMCTITAAVLLLIFSAIFLIIFHEGIKAALMAQVIAYGALWLFLAVAVLRQTGVGLSAEIASVLVRYGSPLILVAAGHLITDSAALFFLGHFRSLEEVAVYSLGYKLAQIAGMVLILPFQMEYEIFVYANLQSPNIRSTISQLTTNLMFAFAFIAFGVAYWSRDVLALIAPPAYASAYLVVLLSVPFSAFDGISYIGESLLNIQKKTYVTAITVTSFSVLAIVLDYLLIPSWGIWGVVTASAVNLTGSGVCVMAFGLKSFPIRLQRRRLAGAALLLASLLAGVFFLKRTSPFIFYGFPPFFVVVLSMLPPVRRRFRYQTSVLFGYRTGASVGQD